MEILLKEVSLEAMVEKEAAGKKAVCRAGQEKERTAYETMFKNCIDTSL